MSIPKYEIEKAAVKFVIDAKDHFAEQRKSANYQKEWLEAEQSYFNGTSDYYDGLSKVRVPLLHMAVEILVPKYEKSIFPADGNWFQSEPKNLKNEMQVLEAILSQEFLRQQFIDIRARSKIISAIRACVTYGTVFVKTKWEHKIKENYDYNKQGKRVKKWVTLFDNPDVYVPSIWDIYADTKDEDLEGLVIERIVKDYEDLYTNRKHTEDGEEVGLFENVEQLKGNINPNPPIEKSDDELKSDKKIGFKDYTYGSHELKIEALEAWGQIPKWFLTGNEEDKENHLYVDGFIVVGLRSNGEGVALLIRDNPFDHQELPYLRARYIPVNGRLYGLGVMSVNISLERELNTLRNQAMDSRTFNLKPKWLRDIRSGISDAALKDLAQQIIDTNDINGLQALRPNDFTSVILASEANIKQDLYDSTGATKSLAGTPSGSSLDRTATGLTAVIQSGLDRLELAVTVFEEELLKPLVKKFWQLNQQFLPAGREISIFGQQLIRVEPRKIELPTINFTGIREIAAKEFRINTLNILLQNIAPFAQFGIDPIPILFAQLRLMGMTDLVKEIDKRPNSEEQLEQTPEGEVQLLLQGRKVKVDINDNHEAYIQAYRQLLAQSNIPDMVAFNTKEALGQRLVLLKIKNNPELLSNIKGSESSVEISD